MTESKEVEIEISDAVEDFRTIRAVSNPQMSYNIIERAVVEGLQWQWTPSDVEVPFNFSDHASPPLGRCELTWCWKESPITRSDVFVVVQEVKGTSRGVIIGPAGPQLRVVESSDDILTFTQSTRSKGTMPSKHCEMTRLLTLAL